MCIYTDDDEQRIAKEKKFDFFFLLIYLYFNTDFCGSNVTSTTFGDACIHTCQFWTFEMSRECFIYCNIAYPRLIKCLKEKKKKWMEEFLVSTQVIHYWIYKKSFWFFLITFTYSLVKYTTLSPKSA